jgi:hypothetical protein
MRHRRELSEISLVERLANRFAVVQSRFPVGPHVQFYKHLESSVDVLTQLAAALPQLMMPTPAKSAGATMHKNGLRWPQRGDHMIGGTFGGGNLRKRSSSAACARFIFSELAAELNNRSV